MSVSITAVALFLFSVLSLDSGPPYVLTSARAKPSAPAASASARPGTNASNALVQRDIGPYADLKSAVRLVTPEWLNDAPSTFAQDPRVSVRFRCVRGVAVEVMQAESSANPSRDAAPADDLDGDGIPTSLDILIGAKKTVLLATPYVETYRVLDYPNGDMPRAEGVCSDVIVRAMRNAGYDLQSLIQNDRRIAPAAYPAIQKPDRNIDHRRVRNILVYFRRHFTALRVEGASAMNYLPGDVVFFNTMGDFRPDHVGIVSDRLGPSNLPLIINSWTTGSVTQEMDLLSFVPVTHHFRVGPSQ